jgi:hypothetical protein
MPNLILRYIFITLLSCLVFSGCKNQDQSRQGKNGGFNSADTVVSMWTVIPGGNRSLNYTILQDSGYWKIKMPDHKTADADLKTISRALRHWSQIRNPQPASLDKKQWDNEGIGDNGTMVIFSTGDHNTDSMIIGKLEFLNGNKSSYYLRKPGTDKVFMVKEVYLDGSVIAPVESYRKRQMVPIDFSLFKKIRIVTPGSDEYYLIEKVHETWTINGQDALQDKVNAFARMLTMIQIPAFSEAPKEHPGASLIVFTDYGEVKLTATENEPGTWILASSVNVGNYLKLTTPQVNAIFPTVTGFVKK